MRDYTKRDQDRYSNPDIKKTALLKFQEKLEVCRDLMHGYDYTAFKDCTETERALIIKGGVNFLFNPLKEEDCKNFVKEAGLLKNAVSLCRSLLGEEERYESAFYEAVRSLLNKMKGRGPLTKKEINARIGTLLSQSVKSSGVINLFADIKTEFSIFDPGFLEEISRMKEKNIAVEILKKLLADRIQVYQRSNLVQSQKFSEMLNMTLSNYLKGLITNEEVIEELLKMAKEIAEAENKANELGLSKEEKAFYDALTRPRAVQDFYSNDQLVEMTKELTEALRKNRTIDWQKKESARAGMRRLIKRLLKKYKYPPEEEQNALDIVLKQCEQWADVEPDYVYND
jgi:type I restriction enzyme R subunit